MSSQKKLSPHLLITLLLCGCLAQANALPDAVVDDHTPHKDDEHESKKGGCTACHDLSEVLGDGEAQGGLQRKVSFTRMMMLGKSAKRVEASDNELAKESLSQAKQKVAQADEKLKQGDEISAQVFLAAAMKLFNTSTQLVPSEASLEKSKQQYQQRLAQLEVARLNHRRNFNRMITNNGEAAGVRYDEARVEALIVEAEQQFQLGEYGKAVELLGTGQDEVQGAIRTMMDNQEIVYKLEIDTPEKEYNYEFNKYTSYEELIPIAIERLKPTSGQQMLAKRVNEKAQWMAEQSKEKAASGDYPTAIRMIQDATREIRKGLKLLGVPDLG